MLNINQIQFHFPSSVMSITRNSRYAWITYLLPVQSGSNMPFVTSLEIQGLNETMLEYIAFFFVSFKEEKKAPLICSS